MPYLPELNYFYLYYRKHIADAHGIACERAANSVLTLPLIEKIKSQILASDLVIADISGRNPNVFFELGIADAHQKPVIAITRDPVSEAPSDVRHMEFIQYDLSKEVEFLAKLDNALHNAFAPRYQPLYLEARALLGRFNRETGLHEEPCTEETFRSRAVVRERTDGPIPVVGGCSPPDLLVPLILRDGASTVTMQRLLSWLDAGPSPRSVA
jgi:hypothetical protein